MPRCLTLAGLLFASVAGPSVVTAQRRPMAAVPRRPVTVIPLKIKLAESIPVPALMPQAPPRRVASPRPSPSPSLRVDGTTYVLSRLDNNVFRDNTNVASSGLVSGTTVRVASPGGLPWLSLEYDVAIHRYSATNQYDRVSQRGRVVTAWRPARAMTFDLVTEGSLKGSSEDRDVSDQLTLMPRTSIRLDGDRRLRVSAAQRWRRYPLGPEQNAVNRYASGEFRHQLHDGSEFEVEGRIERNDAVTDRFDYDRMTWSAGYLTKIGRRVQLAAELQYREQRYRGRFVEVEDEDVRRRDHRVEPTLGLSYAFAGVLLDLAWEPEWRTSNDPEKGFGQQVLLLGLRRNW